MQTLAINAPVSPRKSGGVESNLASMLEVLGTDAHLPMNLAVLTYPQFVDEFQLRTPFAQVRPWRYHIDESWRPAVRGQAVRNAMGSMAPLFDRFVSFYRKVRYGTPPSKLEENSETLKRLAIKAIHFPTSQWFETPLPFIYEPWDLQHLHYPTFFSQAEFDLRERTYRPACEKAKLVITATQWVKNDVIDKYGIPPGRIAVVRRSSLVGRRSLSDSQIDEELRRVSIEGEFIFFPAMTFEHKNHVRLLEALALLRDSHEMRPKLVLSGRRNVPHTVVVRNKIEELGLGTQVIDLGEVSDDMLTALYRRAQFMIFPSLFEGLGLPLLEAFQNRVPILAARATCIPEVVGDAALLFEGSDVEDMARVMRQALDDHLMLQELVTRGVTRLDGFSWTKNLPLLVACYKHVLGMPLNPTEQSAFTAATVSH